MSGADEVLVRRTSMMGTVVSIEVIGHAATDAERAERTAAVTRALDWFRETEAS